MNTPQNTQVQFPSESFCARVTWPYIVPQKDEKVEKSCDFFRNQLHELRGCMTYNGSHLETIDFGKIRKWVLKGNPANALMQPIPATTEGLNQEERFKLAMTFIKMALTELPGHEWNEEDYLLETFCTTLGHVNRLHHRKRSQTTELDPEFSILRITSKYYMMSVMSGLYENFYTTLAGTDDLRRAIMTGGGIMPKIVNGKMPYPLPRGPQIVTPKEIISYIDPHQPQNVNPDLFCTLIADLKEEKI
ncbi:MAG: hypothetical protein AAF570_07315, partial [Bacteroidota bacterium]